MGGQRRPHFTTSRIEQYGIEYADMANALRAQTPPAADQRLGCVETIANSGQVLCVKFNRGEELTSRLVVGTSVSALGSKATSVPKTSDALR